MKLKDLIKHLREYHDQEQEVAWHIWMIDDVVTLCEEYDLPMPTPEQQNEILAQFDRKCDSEYGLTWDGLRYHYDEIMEGA